MVTDDILVDMAKGTGCVKVTPAHDPHDYGVWEETWTTVYDHIFARWSSCSILYAIFRDWSRRLSSRSLPIMGCWFYEI